MLSSCSSAWLVILVLLSNNVLQTIWAHESCCEAKKRKLQQLQGLVGEGEYHHDMDMEPPDEYEGEKRYIPDPNNLLPPNGWDEEDDGIWKPPLIENPNYKWTIELATMSNMHHQHVEPPDEYEGEKRYIPDPNNLLPPNGWDEEDDGIWVPPLIENPNYNWTPGSTTHEQTTTKTASIPFLGELRSEIMMVIPWVTLGVFLITIMNVFSFPFPLEKIRQYLSTTDENQNNSSNILPLLKASILGLCTPLCSCGAIPIASGMISNGGVPLSSALAFLTASQSAGIDSAMITWGILGPMAALCRLLGAICLSMAVGIAIQFPNDKNRTNNKTNYVGNKNETTTAKEEKGSNVDNCGCTTTTSSTSCCDNQNSTINNENRKGEKTAGQPQTGILIVHTLIDTVYDIIPMVFIGITISTAIIYYLPTIIVYLSSTLPPSIALSVKEESSIKQFITRLLIFTIALPLQLCEHTTVTVASTIQQIGGTPGLAFSFLLMAPATNLSSMFLLLKIATTETKAENSKDSKTKLLFRMIFALLSMAMFFSYVVDFLNIDMLVDKEAEADNGGIMMDLPSWYVQVCPWIISSLLILGIIKKVKLSVEVNAATRKPKLE